MTEDALVELGAPDGAVGRRVTAQRGSTQGAAFTSAALLLGAVVTAAAYVAGTLGVGAHARTPQTTLEAAGAVVALCTAYVVYVRFRRRSSSDDLLVCAAFCVFSAASLTLAIPSTSRAAVPAVRFVVWAPLGLALVAAVLLAAASLMAPRRVRRRNLAVASVAVAAGVAVAAVEVGVWQLGRSLPLPAVPAASDGLELVGPTSLLAGDVALTLLLVLAALAFAARAAAGRDELAGWLGCGCTVAAFAPFEHAVLAASSGSWIYGNDVVQLSAYALVLVGAVRDDRRSAREAARAALEAERRRFAWALHDELTQDLAAIGLYAQNALADGDPGPWLEEIAVTAERTLASSRSAISILSDANPPLDEMLAIVAEDAAARAGLRATVSVDPGREPDAWTAEALVRIVREAIWNAARHGAATDVTVNVARDSGLRLVARDNGAGFDVQRVRERGGGFGLASIRAQVEELGGTLTVSSAPGRGTVVEAGFPCDRRS